MSATLIVTPLTASALALLYYRAAWAIIQLRRKHSSSMGDGGEQALQRAIRAHGNLTEYTPMALILLLCLELNGTATWIVAFVATLFIAGRVIHWRGFRRDDLDMKSRVLGMQLTLFPLLALALLNVLMLFR